MKTSLPLAAIAFAVLSLAPQARADEVKRFEVAVATTSAERSGLGTEAARGRAARQDTPIVIEILSVAYLPDQAAAKATSEPVSGLLAKPANPAQRP